MRSEILRHQNALWSQLETFKVISDIFGLRISFVLHGKVKNMEYPVLLWGVLKTG